MTPSSTKLVSPLLMPRLDKKLRKINTTIETTKPFKPPNKNPATRLILPNPADSMDFFKRKLIILNAIDNKIKQRIKRITLKKINVKVGVIISPKLRLPSKVIFLSTV